MEENFNVVAQSRAAYYTPNSPVQFVRIEVLQGDQTQENAVCLTFKNIAPTTITRLEIVFKCKAADGLVLCEQSFHYDNLEVKTGELFGMDDAVFVTQESIGSADIVLEKVYSGKKTMNLAALHRVRLPSVKELSPEVAQKLCQRMNREDLTCEPETLDTGWRCACGAFHPTEEQTVYCSECGSDRILLENTLQAIYYPERMVNHEPEEEHAATVIAGGAAHAADQTRMFTANKEKASASSARPDATVRVDEPLSRENIDKFAKQYAQDLEEGDEYIDPRDELAETLIRWVPAITAIVCAAIALGAFLYCQLAL